MVVLNAKKQGFVIVRENVIFSPFVYSMHIL